MSDENNRRYVGEVFIDGKSDKLLQEFLTELFNRYNGPGKGFNADMVDDWHLDDILNYVDTGLETKLGSITIGQSIYSVSDPNHYLFLTDIIYDEFLRSPWVAKIMNAPNHYGIIDSTCFDEDHYLASDIILDLYTVLDQDKVSVEDFEQLVSDFEELVDEVTELSDDYHEFKGAFDGILRDVEIVDKDGNTVIKKMLDAQLINGFRIIPITQANYDALNVREKEYWRNIYIIMDNVPDDYVDPISFELFKEVKLVYNRETQYLDYYDGISSTPRPLISLADLLAGVDFSTEFNEYISNTSNVVYNPTALKESLKEIHFTSGDLPDMPFVTKEEAVNLAGNIVTTQGTISKVRDGLFSKYDISNAFNTKFDTKENLSNKATTFTNNINDTKYPTVKAVNTEIDKVESWVNSNYYNVNYIDNQLANINSTLSSYNTKLSQINTKVPRQYEHYFMRFWDGTKHQMSTNEYGLSLTIRDNIGILIFNNLNIISMSKGWRSVICDDHGNAVPLFGAQTWEELPQNYYATATAPFDGGLHRMRITGAAGVEIYVDENYANRKFGIGWGQLVFPVPEGYVPNAQNAFKSSYVIGD